VFDIRYVKAFAYRRQNMEDIKNGNRKKKGCGERIDRKRKRIEKGKICEGFKLRDLSFSLPLATKSTAASIYFFLLFYIISIKPKYSNELTGWNRIDGHVE
jgi:hypothetical protein